MYLSSLLFSSLSSQFKLVGDLRGDVLEGDGCSSNAFEANPIKGEARQLAHLHLPLDEVVPGGVPRHA